VRARRSNIRFIISQAAAGGEQMKRRSWQKPAMQAPQSQFLSEVQTRRSQWCDDVELALQSVLGGHLNAPPTHGTGEHPFASAPAAAAHVNPVAQLNPSAEQLAIAQPCTSAPVRVGAQVVPTPQA
jgi:hypothetical protein